MTLVRSGASEFGDLVFERADVEDRERRIDFLHRLADGAGERSSVAVGPHVQRRLRRVVLQERLIDERRRVFGDAVVLAVPRRRR